MTALEVLDLLEQRTESALRPGTSVYRALDKTVIDNRSLVAALRAVLTLHRPTVGGFDLSKPVCLFCERNDEPLAYPCPTVRAITEALDGSR